MEGEAGADGAGCSVSKSNGVATVWCGATSAQVADGAKGPAGSGCSVSKTGNVAAIDCGGDVVEISDGEGAANAEAAALARALVRKAWERREHIPAISRLFLVEALDQTAARLGRGR